jgi:hypothetical protein
MEQGKATTQVSIANWCCTLHYFFLCIALSIWSICVLKITLFLRFTHYTFQQLSPCLLLGCWELCNSCSWVALFRFVFFFLLERSTSYPDGKSIHTIYQREKPNLLCDSWLWHVASNTLFRLKVRWAIIVKQNWSVQNSCDKKFLCGCSCQEGLTINFENLAPLGCHLLKHITHCVIMVTRCVPANTLQVECTAATRAIFYLALS